MWAGQLSTPAVPQGRWFGHLLVVASLDWYTSLLRALLVVKRLIGPDQFIAQLSYRERRGWERSLESASFFIHLQLLLQTWSMEIKWGRGERTEWTVWKISAAASSHMSNHSSDWTTSLCWYPLFISACQASVRGSRAGPNGVKKICFFQHKTWNKENNERLGFGGKCEKRWRKCTAHYLHYLKTKHMRRLYP